MKITIDSDAATLQKWLCSNGACEERMDFYIGKSVKEGLSQAPVDDLAWLLQFEEAVALMTNAQFERVVKCVPWTTALIYEHACERLNDMQFDKCVKVNKKNDWEIPKHAVERMEKMKNE